MHERRVKQTRAFGPDLHVLVELPGIETDALPGNMPSELRFRSVSVPFSPVRYLRFRSRVLTASRASTRGRAFHEAREFRATAATPVRRLHQRGGPLNERGAGSGAAFVFGEGSLDCWMGAERGARAAGHTDQPRAAAATQGLLGRGGASPIPGPPVIRVRVCRSEVYFDLRIRSPGSPSPCRLSSCRGRSGASRVRRRPASPPVRIGPASAMTSTTASRTSGWVAAER